MGMSALGLTKGMLNTKLKPNIDQRSYVRVVIWDLFQPIILSSKGKTKKTS